jgi:hypothetical protein
MANIRCKIENLDEAIGSILEEYRDDITEATKQAVKVVANVAKEEVKAGSPVGKYTKHKGRYKKGWAVKEETVSRLQAKAIVHNRTDYQLAHLLEKGHVLKRGGRTLGRVPAQVHIAPAEEHAIKNFEEAVEKIAKG